MLASNRRHRRQRRGIILVLVLGMLGLMALLGVTFATFSSQSRISARNFAKSVNQPQRDELMDYALAQLVSDTSDARSAIRGHSMARDMYGNDARFNGYLESRPDGVNAPPMTDPYFYITAVVPVANSTLYDLTTNIPVGDPAFYGYDFTRWVMRVTTVAGMNTRVVGQSLEIIRDSQSGAARVFRVNINPQDASTHLDNVTNGTDAHLPGFNLVAVAGGTGTLATHRFILDGRWLRAFNGSGVGSLNNANARANYRYNGLVPGAVGMDEDYDAVDLENWFLAMQSADGSVIIPSFHRPSILRRQYNATGGVVIDDWKRVADTSVPALSTWTWQDSAARIFRPVAADGHDAATFPDLTPDANGRIRYDVDNDGDGQTDSVWVDLGYPARRNSQGQLYKPLFAFMVIGLNGRIPLNTAGNLAGGRGVGVRHSEHLGNSVSEVDPTYGLQNGFRPTLPSDAFPSPDHAYAFLPLVFDTSINAIRTPDGTPVSSLNTQVDSGNVDVRLTQLRNLLAGTRPQRNPTPLASQPQGFPMSALDSPMLKDPYNPSRPQDQVNGDQNFVAYSDGRVYFMPNGISEAWPVDAPRSTASPLPVKRATASFPGRWGEAQTVRGNPIFNPVNNRATNFVENTYKNEVRAGNSLDPGDVINEAVDSYPRDAADDNYNTFDVYPAPDAVARLGEVFDADLYDAAGALLLPVERMRRWVTPADINGTGRIVQWDGVNSAPGPNLGGDLWGRVLYSNYFRPPGLPGQVEVSGADVGAILFPWASGSNYPSNLVRPNEANNNSHNNNPLHGFESFRFPNLQYGGGYRPQSVGGTPFNLPSPGTTPSRMPTYDARVNGDRRVNSDGLNEADEMNLYRPNPLHDSPFSFSDLDWLYRAQDVDGPSLTSRLSQLAPISFTNTVDGLRRRRLYSIDTWEPINYVWTNDNPGNAFQLNSRFAQNTNAGFATAAVAPGLPAPSLAHREKKINLNYPLPVSNDPNEPIRQKWISDAYQTLKLTLPPKAVDTPEELAQLSQYLINVIDFRDPDCTMTHWVNPDVRMAVWNAGAAPIQPTLIAASATAPTNTVAIPLNQYGMELSPIAINEVLAYAFKRKGGSPAGPLATPRFFLELVNTLTSPETGTAASNASLLDLSGLLSNPATPPTAGTSWNNACWDVIFTADDIASRPDPYLGQLQYKGNVYGLLPLTQEGMTNTTDVTANPLPQKPGTTGADYFGTNYFLTIGNPIADSGAENSPIAPGFGIKDTYDPFRITSTTPPTPTAPVGVLPLIPNQSPPQPQVYPGPIPATVTSSNGSAQFYWICLRRPANPFAPVSEANPMIVVDSMRFPYIESKGTGTTDSQGDHVNPPKNPYPQSGLNTLYSYQRFQPYRGGHAVAAAPPATGLDTRYGYTEQIAMPITLSALYGKYMGGTDPQADDSSGPQITNTIYHTIGFPNDGAFLTPMGTPTVQEQWDWVPFHDRDFTSVAELMLVPGCPPGMFTKQFAEFAPNKKNVDDIFKPFATTPVVNPTLAVTGLTAFTYFSDHFNYLQTTNPVIPHTFPYLVDKFFYKGASDTTVRYGDRTGDGWFKMFEFFEVPSQMNGAVGPVAQGMNFDWAREDSKPGLINLNLIVDEEVFFSVFGRQGGATGFIQELLNFGQIPNILDASGTALWKGGAWGGPWASGVAPLPLVVSETNAVGSPSFVYPMSNVGVVAPDPLSANLVDNRMKVAFAQFLSLRHGGSGFVFGNGNGAVGQNFTATTSPANPNNTNPFGIPADLPFRSLSYPDINFTVMRPAALPPSQFTDPQRNVPAADYPPTYNASGTAYVDDPGLRNGSLYQGFAPGTAPTSSSTDILVPPAIPSRRLFQVPDFSLASNAGATGDPYINNIRPVTAGSAAGALPTFQSPPPPQTGTPFTVTGVGGPVNLLQSGVPAGKPVTLGTDASGALDNRQHPYFRSEMMQKAMNLTTVRTHQYAVWITVGFFEVVRQGDLGMLFDDPRFAFDILGAEIGSLAGQTTRYRGFFVVDRLQLTGFDPNTPGSFRPAVLYRQTIE